MSPTMRTTLRPVAWATSMVLLLGFAPLVMSGTRAAAAGTTQPPNLILLLTDDQTIDSMSQGLPYLNSRPGRALGGILELLHQYPPLLPFPRHHPLWPLRAPQRRQVQPGWA